MNPRRQTNTFIGGMNMDLDYSVIKDNQYQYAENIRILTNDNGSTGVMQNIEGFIKTNPSTILYNETIIHVDTIRDWAIVFTNVNGTENFNIYRYDFSKSELEPQVTKIVNNKPLGIERADNGIYAISSVCRWESDDNVKIYWCDGSNQIKLLNVDPKHDASNVNVTKDSITIIPKGTLPALTISGYGSGSLKAGKYQYAYQLFNPRSSETSISAVSKLFTTSKNFDASNSQNVIGSEQDTNTGLSIKLQAALVDNTFTRAKIIRLYYKNNSDLPQITVIDDVTISNNILSYEDKGGSTVNELTVDEFNALVSYQFIPKVLESKNNMLFAANITEETWDITDEQFDARAYRCDKSGNIALISNSSQDTKTFNADNIPSDIPIDHDCICPYNYDDGSDYRYLKTSTGNYILGGQGLNLYYRFILGNLVEDSSTLPTLESGFNEDFSLVSKKYNTRKLKLYSVVDDSGRKDDIGGFILPTSSNILNYSNPYVDAYMRGYQRDEIYRFGIVFYNQSNIASSVHWIADIRMPAATDNGYELFSSGKIELDNDVESGRLSVVTHPLGIEFNIYSHSLEALRDLGVTGYEIVRCERTISDRTILAQGIVSQVTEGDDMHGNPARGSSLFAMPYLSFAKDHFYTAGSSKYRSYLDMGGTASENYFMFVSPDICVNRENANEVIDKFDSLKPLYTLKSPINPTIGDVSKYEAKVLANAKSIKYDGRTIISTEGLDYNKNNGYINYSTNVATGKDVPLITWDAGNHYTATLAKYYRKTILNAPEATVNDAILAVQMDPMDYKDNAWLTKPTTIGDKQYYNWGFYTFETDGDTNNVQKEGPHGICAIFRSDDLFTKVGFIDSSTDLYNANAVMLVNMKQNASQYGGNSHASRQNSAYISCGMYNTSDTSYARTYGGDTYIGVLDYTNMSFLYNELLISDDEESARTHRVFNGAYIPCESTINLSLRSDNVQVSKTYEAGSGYANHFVQNEVIQLGDFYTQTMPLYAYTSAYSAQGKGKIYVSKSIYNIDNLLTDGRVLNSEPKTNNEVTDSWTKFKVANYIDVDNRFGSINNMQLFKNNLMFWQDDAFGTLAVNERSLIQDNNIGQLVLGTGGILARYDYVTTKNGSKKNQLRNVTQSDGAVYWYDDDRKEICGFDGQLQTLSKIKGVQSYLADKEVPFSINPELCYDKKYNEVLFTLENKTLVFNEQLGVMTSFYTFNPDWYIEFSDKIYTFKSLNLFKYNAGDDVNLYSDKDKISYIKFVVNADYPQTKTFDNVEYGGDFTYGTNFYDIYFQTKRQTSYVTDSDQIDYREDTYKFAIPRNSIELTTAEQLANKSYKDRMKGKYVVCNYKYDCNDGNTFKVPYISTAYRYSMI